MSKLSLKKILKEAEDKMQLPLKHRKKNNQVPFDDMTRYVDDVEELQEDAPTAQPPKLTRDQYGDEYRRSNIKLQKLLQMYQSNPSSELEVMIQQLKPKVQKLGAILAGATGEKDIRPPGKKQLDMPPHFGQPRKIFSKL